MPQQLFLSGVGRSGTTALRRSLGLHPQIYYNGHENNLVQDVVEVAHKNLTTQSRLNSMVVPEETYLSSFRELIESVIWPSRAELSDRPVWMAAANLDELHMQTICRLFPGAKFVCLIRNGLSVVASRMRYQSFRAAAFEDHCRVWQRSAKMAGWARQHKSLARIVRQEDFLDPELMQLQSAELFDLIGAEHCDAVANNLVSRRYHATGDGKPFEITAAEYEQFDCERRREFESRRQERWREWTDGQRAAFASICGASMLDLRYKIPWQL